MATARERWSDVKFTPGANGYTAERAWDVDGATSAADALAASGIPDINDAHPLKSDCKVKSLPVERNGFNSYLVRAIYETPADGNSHPGPGAQTDPLDMPPTIYWEIGSTSEEIDRDVNGNPLTNSAGDPYTGVTREFTTYYLILEQNEASFDVDKAGDYSNYVNSHNFSITGVGTFAAGNLLCKTIAPCEPYTSGASYVRVRYTFEARVDGFKRRFRDEGVYAWYSNSGDKKGQIYLKTGEQITAPVLLDGTGGVKNYSAYNIGDPRQTYSNANIGNPPGAEVVTETNAIFLKYQVYPSRSFTGIFS